MLTILHMLLIFVAGLFKSRSRLEAENLFLRHQLKIALRRARPRLQLRGGDRVLLVWMVRLWPSLLGLAKTAGNHPAMASVRLQSVLALEIPE
jgi:hypothetical protein